MVVIGVQIYQGNSVGIGIGVSAIIWYMYSWKSWHSAKLNTKNNRAHG